MSMLAYDSGRALRRLRALTLALCSLALCSLALCSACGGEPVPQGPLSPGVSGGAVSGSLVVRVVDPLRTTPVDTPSLSIVREGRADLFLMGPASLFEIDDAELVGPFTIRAGATEWGPIQGAQVVLPVGRVEAPDMIAVEISGFDTGEASVRVDGFRPTRIASMNPLFVGSPGMRPVSDGVVRTVFERADPANPQVAVVLVGEDGITQSFSVGTVVDGLLELAPTRLAGVRVAVTWPGPPAFADRVVGVPGLALASSFAILPQDSTDSVVVPVPSAVSPDARIWFVAEASGGALGTEARSVVVQRGVANLDITPTFPDWLEPPDVRVEGAALLVTPRADAQLLVVDWVDAGGARLGQTWRWNAGTAELSMDVPVAATRAIVRSYDATIDASAFELAVLDATIRRFAERRIAF